MKELEAEFLGRYFWDGCLTVKNNKAQFSITGDLKEEKEFYKRVVVPEFNELFNLSLKLSEYKSNGVCGLYYSSKNFARELQETYNLKPGKKLNVNLPLLKTKNEKIAFLRGIFDTDGSIYFCKSYFKTKKPTFCNSFHYKPKIKIALISEKIITFIYNIFLELDLSPRMYSPRKQKKQENIIYALVLDNDKDVKKWITEIGFKNIKHKTKVKVWEKYGFCPPKTTIKDRYMILQGVLDPLTFYSWKQNDL